MLGDAIDDTQAESHELIEPAAGKQGAVATVVHQRKTARRQQHQQRQDRQQPKPHRRGSSPNLAHQPPQEGHGNQGADHLQPGSEVVALAEGVELKITAAQRASSRA
jgi:hypothetical protein